MSKCGNFGVQGNPLIPDDLRSVAASQAASTCVVSDTSRCTPKPYASETQKPYDYAPQTPIALHSIASSQRLLALCYTVSLGLELLSSVQNSQQGLCDGSTVTVAVAARYPSEADAQSLRVAVLLDELDFPVSIFIHSPCPLWK